VSGNGDGRGGGTLWIESTRGGAPDGDARVRLIVPGEGEFHPPVDDVRQTALDLITCAAWADLMLSLTDHLGLTPDVVGAMVSELLRRSGRRRAFGRPSTINLLPAGSSATRTALVLIDRGEFEGMVTAEHARGMALAWLEVAEATESDNLVSRGLAFLGAAPALTVDLFAWLRRQRGEEPTNPEARR
jgi:hypothetical protein